MKLPAGMTEAYFLKTLDEVIDLLYHKFVFAIFDKEDIKQQARLEGIRGMAKYDPARPLPNFLYVHIHNRLCNFLRDNFRRNDPPCKLCKEGRQALHPDGMVCEAYKEWKRRNDCKASIMQPTRMTEEAEEKLISPAEAEDQSSLNELKVLIDRAMPVGLRPTYLRMVAGEKVSRSRRLEVEQVVREVMNDGT